MVFISKNSLSLLPEDIFCCSVKDHHVSVLKATSNFVNEKTGGMPMALMDLKPKCFSPLSPKIKMESMLISDHGIESML